MQSIRSSILRHVRLRCSRNTLVFNENNNILEQFMRHMCTSESTTSASEDKTMDRVIGLVKKFNKLDASKVTKTANFQKDLCMDSLDRVELVMAFEEEFSIEIPDENADKLTCCADVAKYIMNEVENKTT